MSNNLCTIYCNCFVHFVLMWPFSISIWICNPVRIHGNKWYDMIWVLKIVQGVHWEDWNLQWHCCENAKSHTSIFPTHFCGHHKMSVHHQNLTNSYRCKKDMKWGSCCNLCKMTNFMCFVLLCAAIIYMCAGMCTQVCVCICVRMSPKFNFRQHRQEVFTVCFAIQILWCIFPEINH